MKSPFAIALLFPAVVIAQVLPLPPRATNAPDGSEFVRRITTLDFTNREQEIFFQITAGNVPDFLRKLCPVSVTNLIAGKTNCATFYAAPDYLSVGSDEDYFFAPMTPVTAQRLADRLGCTLPTRKMVNDIYAAAAVKLAPSPIPPGPQMITVPVFAQHNAIVRTQRMGQLAAHPFGALVAGDKKDIVITARLTNSPGKVAIYGWHQTNGLAIQPLYLGHTAAWADYSHGVRLVQQKMLVNGQTTTVAKVLADPELSGLLSDEGVVTNPRYPTNAMPPLPSQMKGVLDSARTNVVPANSENPSPGLKASLSPSDKESAILRGTPTFADFKPSGHFDELVSSFTFAPEVKIQVNAPARDTFSPDKPVLLIFYALPNGNTTEQTVGRKMQPGDDWHFDIQHIGAQTRFLRERIKDQTIVVAYLEAEMKSWPAWRKKNGDKPIPDLIATVRKIFVANRVNIVLTGHSGGGSFTFGYLNAVEKIPDDVVRIAFLDSNYGYDPALGHKEKLVNWLEASDRHCLCVLAYNDAVALLDGRPFVSAAGGTWGKSHAMLKDLGGHFKFASGTNGGLEKDSALDGRLQFLFKENPERKILHTVQVERNGFIHAMISGTPYEGKGYEYFGERAYVKWIAAE